MKKLSIITVCYNSEEHIKRCIESILPQLNEETEYIIIDGASKDSTLNIIEETAKDNQFVSVYSEPDNGIYDAMNKGINKAHGEFVIFINSDDALFGGAVKKILDCIGKNSDCDCIYGDADVIEWDENGNEIPIKTWYGDKNTANIEHTMICSHQSFVARKSKIEKLGGFYLGLKIAADWDLILRLYKSGCEFQYLNSTISVFSRGGVSCSKDHEKERHLVRKRNKCYKFFDKEYYIVKKTELYNKFKWY